MRIDKIDVWQFIPPQEDEEPGMPTYRIAGLCHNDHSGVEMTSEFCGDVSIEIDGRDAEYEPLWGFDLRDDLDMWESVWPALMAAPGWKEDFQKRSDEYYG